ncbi:unnamed protein product [Arabis nemorensis]|uniref:Trimethylguanosine synthase n=1 Tax=Arabis nemorensis TaxID=586526 RepID=A0A565ATL4_9BRAS|nr:unnamed protein product [Arabis nemorensis]
MGTVEIEEEEAVAIAALGSLFKLTEVHLWVDGSKETPLVPLLHEQSGILSKESVDDDTSTDLSGFMNIRPEEDMGMIKEMKSLGLPVSFQTNKEWKNRKRGQQRKGIKDRSDEVNVLFNEEDNTVVSTLNLVSDLKSIDHAIGYEDADRLCPENDCVQRSAVEEENHEILGSYCSGDRDRDSVLTSETIDNHDSNEWKVYWDSFYGRSYFYNIKTQESTWEPPLGMEHLAYCYETHNLDELALETTEKPHEDLSGTGPADDVPTEKSDNLGGVCQSQCETEALTEVNSLVDTYHEASIGNQSLDITTLEEEGNGTYVVNSIGKAKKKTRRTRAKKIFFTSDIGTRTEGVIEEYSAILGKYWCQRYLLFSRFDEGIKMDEEGWFSVTPEPIAKHHATRCNGGIVIDCFTGVGGNAIQFASRSHYVIAIDVDPKKLDLAKHNAAIYGVADKIDFVKGDFFDLAHNLKAGTVFLSPPWGGPDYLKASMYDMKTMLRPRDGYISRVSLFILWLRVLELLISFYAKRYVLTIPVWCRDALFKAAMNIASTIIMFLPRNVDINQLAELALSTTPPWSLEASGNPQCFQVEKNYLNGKLKAITAYYVQTT